MDNQYKVLIIGCGRVAVKHIKAIKTLKKDLVLSGVVDTNEEAAKKLLTSSGMNDVKIYNDYKEAIDTLKPDIVAVTVPSGLHYQIADYAMDHDCNLLLEKPMTMSVSEARKLYEKSEATGKHIAMGHIYRYLPIVKLIHDDVAAGVYGKVTHGSIYVRWGHGDDYYNSAAWRGTWKSDGGALMNQSIHAIDLLVWLMNATPCECTAMIAKELRKIEAEDLGMAVLRMKDGSLASIEGTTATSPKDHCAMFSVFCENGSLSMGLKKGVPVMDIKNAAGKKINHKYVFRQIKTYGITSFRTALNPHLGIYDNLASSIKAGKDQHPTADAYAGYSSVDTLMGIYKSALTKKPVNLPLDEDFASTDMTGFFDN